MAPVVPFLADTSLPFTQLLAAEQTAQSVQGRIQEKKDAIATIKKQAIDQDVPYNDIYGHLKQLDDDIRGFKRLLQSNEASRGRWRGLHMAAWRATVRPLKVVDLPHEILSMIFAHFQDVLTVEAKTWPLPANEPLPSPNVATIKKVRLTCRVFCNVGSRFLHPILNISFTRSSLHRLKKISRHSTISKGVQIVQIDMNAYNRSLAIDRCRFYRGVVVRLHILERLCERDLTKARREVAEECRLVGLIPKPKYRKIQELEMVLNETRDLIVTVEKHMHQGSHAAPPLDPFENKISKAIVQAHEEYERRYLEQEHLVQDARTYAYISTAVGLMPSIQRLCITTAYESRKNGMLAERFDEPIDAKEYKSALRGPNPFRILALHPGACGDSLMVWSGDPPFPLVLRLPLMLQAGSANLTYLEIDLPSANDGRMSIVGEELESLRHACRQLKHVEIRGTQNIRKWEPSGSLATTHTLLEAMLVSTRLEVVKLDLPRHIPVESTPSIGHLLASLSWNKLRTLCLVFVPFKIEELRQLMDKIPGKILLDLSGIRLLEGTWAEALEILRGRADSLSRVVYPRGIEMVQLSLREAKYLKQEFDSEHRDGWYSAQRCPGPASFYIRGGDIPNPLIWVDD